MISPAPNTTRRSRWLDWRPKARIIASSTQNEPAKPSKPSCVGFVGSSPAETCIIRGRPLEQIDPLVDMTAVAVPAMPSCVRLIEWNLKAPPIVIEASALVTDPCLFARTTLEQLRIVLAEPKRRVGWTAPQLIDRLAQLGVLVTLEKEEHTSGSARSSSN